MSTALYEKRHKILDAFYLTVSEFVYYSGNVNLNSNWKSAGEILKVQRAYS